MPAYHCRVDDFRLIQMGRPHVKLAQKYSMSWGLGWKMLLLRGLTVIGHGRDNPGLHCLSADALQSMSEFLMMKNVQSDVALLKDVGPLLDEVLALHPPHHKSLLPPGSLWFRTEMILWPYKPAEGRPGISLPALLANFRVDGCSLHGGLGDSLDPEPCGLSLL